MRLEPDAIFRWLNTLQADGGLNHSSHRTDLVDKTIHHNAVPAFHITELFLFFHTLRSGGIKSSDRRPEKRCGCLGTHIAQLAAQERLPKFAIDRCTEYADDPILERHCLQTRAIAHACPIAHAQAKSNLRPERQAGEAQEVRGPGLRMQSVPAIKAH